MFLKHYISDRKDRLAAGDAFDQFGIIPVSQPEQTNRCINRREKRVILVIERNELFEKTEQVVSVTVLDENGGHLTAGCRSA